MKKIFLSFLLISGCRTQTTQPPQVQEVILECPETPICEPYVIDSHECKEAMKIMKYRNDRIHERMDECLEENEYLDCLHWVFGYITDEEKEEYPPPRPEDY